jgi:hypothetical protein
MKGIDQPYAADVPPRVKERVREKARLAGQQQAQDHLHAGRLREAEQTCLEILAKFKNDPTTRGTLAAVQRSLLCKEVTQGQYVAAFHRIERSVL